MSAPTGQAGAVAHPPLAHCAAIVPAGGRAERLGGIAKPLLAALDGTTLLEGTVRRLAELGVGHIVIVAPPDVAESAVRAFGGPYPRLTVVREEPAFSGPAAAIAAGALALSAAAGGGPPPWTLIVPGDLPDVGPGALALAGALAERPGPRTAAPELLLGTVAGQDQRMFCLAATVALLDRAGAHSWADSSVRRLYEGMSATRVELPASAAADVDTWAAAADHQVGNRRSPAWETSMAIARAVGRDALPHRPDERVPLGSAAGRVVAEPVVAEHPIPHFDSSAMDGFVVAEPLPVRATGPVEAAGPAWRLETHEVLDHTESGRRDLTPGTARPVLTGGTIPAGAIGVIRQEYAKVVSGTLNLAPGAPASELEPGRHIRPAGRETQAGGVVAQAGGRLTPAHIAYLAVAGCDDVRVTARPRVALIFTGDEVITSGTPAPGQVRDTFGPVLPGVVESWGGEVVAIARVPDDFDVLATAVDDALRRGAELILTTGGTGHSPVDHVRSLLERRAHAVAIPQVRMRPGHPTMLGIMEAHGHRAALVGLPGNPLAAMTALRVVAQPVFEGLAGLAPAPPLRAVLDPRPSGGRADVLLPVRRRSDGTCAPCDGTGSAMLSGLAVADGLAVIPAGRAPGDTVTVLSLPWATSRA